MLSLVYPLLLLNLVFLVGLFFFFRRYIQRELGKVEYVRHLKKELQQLLLDVNRSGEEIIQILEDRSIQLQTTLQQHEAQHRQWKQNYEKASQQNCSIEQYLLRLRELKQDAEENLENFQMHIRSLQEQLHDTKAHSKHQLLESLSSSLEKELLHDIRSEFVGLHQAAVAKLFEHHTEILQDLERVSAEISSSNWTKRKSEFIASKQTEELSIAADTPVCNTEPANKVLSPQQRTEIEQYLNLGFDSRIISQKTGVALNLVEILASLKGSS